MSNNGLLMQAQMLIDNEDYDKAYEYEEVNVIEKLKEILLIIIIVYLICKP